MKALILALLFFQPAKAEWIYLTKAKKCQEFPIKLSEAKQGLAKQGFKCNWAKSDMPNVTIVNCGEDDEYWTKTFEMCKYIAQGHIPVALNEGQDVTPVAVGKIADLNRQVVGGDILQTESASGSTETEAMFLAQQAAIRALLIECKIPHRDIKIFEKRSEHGTFGWQASVQAGLSHESCEEGKKARGPAAEKLKNPQIVKDQALYDKMLEHRIGK